MKPALLLLCALTAPAACLVEGRVLDAETGKPLPKTQVFAKPGPLKLSILHLTDDSGAFCFERLDAGAYQLAFHRTGYLDSLYGARPGADQGIVLVVDGPAAVPPVTVKMLRSAEIGGTLLEAGGEPLEGASLQLLRKVWDGGWNSDVVGDATTDDRGVFRFGRLAPGNYYVCAVPSQGPGMTTYYSRSFTFARATPIAVKPGDSIDNLAMTLNPWMPRHLSGRLAEALRPESASIILQPMGGRTHYAAEIPPDGSFSVDAPPGKYRLRFRGVPAAPPLEIDLTDGDITGLVVEPQRAFDLAISATLDGQPAPGQLALMVREVESGAVLTAHEHLNQGFRFPAVPAGLYRIEAGDQGAYVKNLIVDGKPRRDSLLDLRSAAPASIEVVMSRDVARVTGRLENSQTSLAVTVVRVDQEKSRTEALGGTTPADHTGQFKMDSLAPGRYRFFAIEGLDPDLWGSPELAAALAAKSVAVELRAGESRQLTLPVISAEEWTVGLRKSGM
jgi:hypothetical protein